jgi:hypothetical protein
MDPPGYGFLGFLFLDRVFPFLCLDPGFGLAVPDSSRLSAVG